MSKRLILVRHGKSDHRQDIHDFDRPLNHRGHKNAVEMAERLQVKNLIPELLVSSPALRALTTAGHFAETWTTPVSAIQKKESIYEANTTALLQVVNQLDNQFNKIALFGHNPGFTDLANYLSDSNLYNIPTAGVVMMDFEAQDWKEVSFHTGTMLLFDYPKNTEEPH